MDMNFYTLLSAITITKSQEIAIDFNTRARQ